MSVRTVTRGTLEYLTADNIDAAHCFTTRLGGVSKGHLASLNLGANRGDAPGNVEENFRILSHTLGFEPGNLVPTRQTHSDIVRAVTKGDHLTFNNHDYPECDALITNDPGTALMVFSADCTPILFHDPVTGAVGAAHAGWRGTAAAIAGKTVKAMTAAFGCKPENIRAAIGPNIAQCCFETDGDVPQAMCDAFGDRVLPYIRKVGQKYYVNLKEINAMILRDAGIVNIDISTHCTACRNDLFWSHRLTGGNRGSQGAIIVCKEA